jgi:hypothetical protein
MLRRGPGASRIAWIAFKAMPDIEYDSLPPRLYLRLGILRFLLLVVSLTAALSYPAFGPRALLAGGALAGVGLLLPHMVRSVIASGLDNEVPTLLLYLIPYAWSPGTLADLIAGIADKKAGFRWLRIEASRLRRMLEWGSDPLSALQRLAKTTPSQTLRETLEELVHSARMGFPRSLLLSRLAERALEGVRRRWQSYSELSKTIAEANAAVIVAAGVMAPLASLSGSSASAALPLAVLLPAISALGLIVFQPSSGPGRVGFLLKAAPLLAGYAAIALLLIGSSTASTAILTIATVIVEAYGLKIRREIKAALRALGRAAREARLGRIRLDLLERASKLDPPVLGSILESVRVGGPVRVWVGLEMLENSYSSALRVVDSTRGPAVMSLIVTMISLAVSWYSLGLMASLSATAGSLASLPTAEAALFLRAAAVASGLSVGALLRPYMPSLLPSLVLLESLRALTLMGLGP